MDRTKTVSEQYQISSYSQFVTISIKVFFTRGRKGQDGLVIEVRYQRKWHKGIGESGPNQFFSSSNCELNLF